MAAHCYTVGRLHLNHSLPNTQDSIISYIESNMELIIMVAELCQKKKPISVIWLLYHVPVVTMSLQVIHPSFIDELPWKHSSGPMEW